MRRTLLSGVGVAAMLIGMAATASATPVTVHATPIVFNGSGSTVGTWSGSGSLELFDSNSGPLNSVLVVTELTAISSYAESSNGKLIWTTGSSSTSTNAHPIATSTSTITTGGPSQLAGAAVVSAIEDGGSKQFPGNTPVDFLASGSATISTLITSPLTDWEAPGGGTDPLSITISTTNNLPSYLTLNWPNGGPYFIESISVTYNPSVPEPASLVVLGGGLLALGATRRRRKR